MCRYDRLLQTSVRLLLSFIAAATDIMHFSQVLAIGLPILSALANPVNPREQLETRSAPQCGVLGYKKHDYEPIDRFRGSYSVSQCSTLCKKRSDCKAYSVGTNSCALYCTSVDQTIRTGQHSPYKFYDRACPCPTPRTTSSKSTSCTTSSSKTTTT